MLVGESDADSPLKKILVAVDYSESAVEVLNAGVRIARLTGASVHVVHIGFPPWLFLNEAGDQSVAIPDRVKRDYRREQKNALEGLLLRGDKGCPIGFSTLERCDLVEGLLECQQDVGADLIVVGRRGSTRSDAVLLGGFAERAINEASCAVLVVPPP